MSQELEKNPLWLILVEAAQALPLYESHKAYVRDTMMLDQPDLTAEEVAQRLDMPLGEALVILHELKNQEDYGEPDDDS